jgi:hypothetical protein
MLQVRLEVGVTLGCSVGSDVVGDLLELEVGVTLGPLES